MSWNLCVGYSYTEADTKKATKQVSVTDAYRNGVLRQVSGKSVNTLARKKH